MPRLSSPDPEFPLVLKSRGPGTSSSMKLGVLFAFQGSPDNYQSFFFFSEFLSLSSKRLSYVICSRNYIFSRLTKLALSNKTHLVIFTFTFLSFFFLYVLDVFQWDGLTACP